MMSSIPGARRSKPTQQQDEDRRMERPLSTSKRSKDSSRTDRSLRLHDIAKFRQKQVLLKEWTEKVYNVIQAQIDEQLRALPAEAISERRRKLLEDYIRVSNKKRYGLYRDIIIESEYDPMVAHRTLLRYQMHDQQDPLKIELPDPTARAGRARKGADFAASSARGWARRSHHHVGASRRDADAAADRVPAGQPGLSPRESVRLTRTCTTTSRGRRCSTAVAAASG